MEAEISGFRYMADGLVVLMRFVGSRSCQEGCVMINLHDQIIMLNYAHFYWPSYPVYFLMSPLSQRQVHILALSFAY